MKETNEQIDPPVGAENISPDIEAKPDNASELNELRTENEKLKSEIRFDRARGEVTKHLAKAGAWSPQLMFGAIANELQFDEDGKLMNGAAIVEKLKRDYPESFVSENPVGTIEGGAGAGRGKFLTKEALSKMTAADIAKLDWADVRRILSER